MSYRIVFKVGMLVGGMLICSALVSGCASGAQKSARASLDDDDSASANGNTVSRGAAPHGEFKVSVTSGGKPVPNFQQKLVHRITLSKQDLTALMPVPGRGPQIPFTGKVDRDSNGGIVGLKLTEVRTNTVMPTFGLQDGDMLTAVGSKHVDDLSDLTQIAIDIRKNAQATLTLQRNGLPHKVFYTLK